MSITNVILWALLLSSVISSVIAADKSKLRNEERKMAKLPPCSACSSLVASFEKGLERTARFKLDGGDTAWEEKNQVNGYANSEVRFVEIQERLCSDVERGEAQCHDNHHHWEEHLESWWNTADSERPPLKQFLCVDQLQVCCPDNHYGLDCKPCPHVDEEGQVCSGKGKCKGSGTRKGNGQCLCNQAYGGVKCDHCGSNHYETDKDNKVCAPCHPSCLDQCTGTGPTQCLACRSGYVMHTEDGCQDVDECQDKSKGCKDDHFCVNTPGSHQCVRCDMACKRCDSDGPDNCLECAEGYTRSGGKEDGVCVTHEAAEQMKTNQSSAQMTDDDDDSKDSRTEL